MPKPRRCTYVWGLGKINYSLQSGYKVGTYILLVTEWTVSHETKKTHVTKDVVGLLIGEVVSTKKTHHCKKCGWVAPRRGSKFEKKHIIEKDVVGLLVGY